MDRQWRDRSSRHRAEASFNSLPTRPRRRRFRKELLLQRTRGNIIQLRCRSNLLVRGVLRKVVVVEMRGPSSPCLRPTLNPPAVRTIHPRNPTHPAMPPRHHHPHRRRRLSGHPKLTPLHANSLTSLKTTLKNVIPVVRRRNIPKSPLIRMEINGVSSFTSMGMEERPIIILVSFCR